MRSRSSVCSPRRCSPAVQWTFVQNNGAADRSDCDGASVARSTGSRCSRRWSCCIATFLALLLSSSYLKREHLEGPEYFALMLCSATGMMLMISANDLVTVFLSLEILSIALYVLAAFDRRRTTSQEAGLKYFLLGSFSSAVFLYGVALVYGGTGTTNLTGIADFLATTILLHDGVLLLGIAFLLVGLGFKVAAAPFHMWTPDVYQGSPTPVTAFMASATKAAAFAAILRIFVGSFCALQRRLATDRVRARGAVARRRQRRRDRADRREAHARLLVDQPRRLRVDRGAGRVGAGHERGVVLRAHVRGDDDRRVRVRRGDRRPRRRRARARDLPRPRAPPAAARGLVHAVPARAGRRAAHRAASWRSSRCSAPRSRNASTCSR